MAEPASAAGDSAEAPAPPAAVPDTQRHARHMRRAIELSRRAGLEELTGKCFGAVIVAADGAVVGEGYNQARRARRAAGPCSTRARTAAGGSCSCAPHRMPPPPPGCEAEGPHVARGARSNPGRVRQAGHVVPRGLHAVREHAALPHVHGCAARGARCARPRVQAHVLSHL